MMILKIIGCIIIFLLLILVTMSIFIGTMRTKKNEKIIYKIDKLDNLLEKKPNEKN